MFSVDFEILILNSVASDSEIPCFLELIECKFGNQAVGRHGTLFLGVPNRQARHEIGMWARAWAVGAARGLTRHGPLSCRAGPGGPNGHL